MAGPTLGRLQSPTLDGFAELWLAEDFLSAAECDELIAGKCCGAIGSVHKISDVEAAQKRLAKSSGHTVPSGTALKSCPYWQNDFVNAYPHQFSSRQYILFGEPYEVC